MKIVYEVPESDIQDRKLILQMMSFFKEIQENISEFGQNTMREELFDAMERLERCEDAWLRCQRARVLGKFSESLQLGDGQQHTLTSCKYCHEDY